MPRTSSLFIVTGAFLGVAALLVLGVLGNALMAGLVMVAAVVDVTLGVLMRQRERG